MPVLDQIVNNMPVANQRRQQQRQAATDLQLQQAVAGAPRPATPSAAQALGAGAAQQAGQAMIETAKSNLQTNTQAAGVALQQKQQELQSNLQNLKRGQDTTQLAEENQFAQLNEQAKREMFDNRMNFAADEQGRTFLNERQLADYAVSHVESAEQLRNYAQTAEQASRRDLQALEAAQRKLEQEMTFQQGLAAQKQDHALQQRLAEAKRALEAEIARKKAKAANRAGTMSVIGGLAATGVLIAATGGAGAAYAPAAYAAGSGVGGAAAANTSI